jgi:divinyl protochlorophyllide a 8-vinyl-reductase
VSSPPAAAGRIGPNAALQLLAAVAAREGEGAALRLLAEAGVPDPRPVGDPGMLPVTAVVALHRALLRLVGTEPARALAAEAGRRTAAYLLTHRIPRPFQLVLRVLPRAAAGRLLLGAIARHAWTFTGGGGFTVEPGPPRRLRIAPCPLCPDAGSEGLGCVYYAATFEALLRRLADPSTRVAPAACGAAGARVCLLLAPEASGRPS